MAVPEWNRWTEAATPSLVPGHRLLARGATRTPLPIVSERERTAPSMTGQDVDIEMLLRRVIREEAGVKPVVPAEEWRDGTMVLRPGNGTQEKSWPIETFFHKVVMIEIACARSSSRSATDVPEDVKVKLQAYISACYGSLHELQHPFADEADQFKVLETNPVPSTPCALGIGSWGWEFLTRAHHTMKCRGGFCERQVADVEVPDTGVGQRPDRSCAHLVSGGPVGELTRQRFRGNRQKAAERSERARIR